MEEYFDHKEVKAAYDDWVALMMQKYGYGSRRFMFAKLNAVRIKREQSCFTLTGLAKVKSEEWTGPKDASSIIEIPSTSSDAEIGAALNILVNTVS